MRTLVTIPDPILRQVAEPITAFGSAWLHDLVADMARIRLDAGGVGIAAPQVGESVRAFLLDGRDATGTPSARMPDIAGAAQLVVFNPLITGHDGQAEPGAEGCLSIPATLVEGGRLSILRPPRIRWTGQDIEGAPIGGTLDGFAARAFQHELDHLNGVLISDLVTDAI